MERLIRSLSRPMDRFDRRRTGLQQLRRKFLLGHLLFREISLGELEVARWLNGFNLRRRAGWGLVLVPFALLSQFDRDQLERHRRDGKIIVDLMK